MHNLSFHTHNYKHQNMNNASVVSALVDQRTCLFSLNNMHYDNNNNVV